MNESFSLISVIISAYNHENYVETCLNSILENDYPNKEIIIIDDGSKDNTKNIIENWIEKNNKKIKITFKSRENKGIPKTMNELVDLANGEYIAPIASDDYLLKGGLLKRYQYLKDTPQKLAIIADSIIVDKDGNKLFDSARKNFYKVALQAYETDSGLIKEVLTRFKIPGPTLMVNKKIFKIVGKYNESVSTDDLYMYSKIVHKHLLGYIDEPVLAYRLHGENLTSAKTYPNILKSEIKVHIGNLFMFKNYRKLIAFTIIFKIILLNYIRIKQCIFKDNNLITRMLFPIITELKEYCKNYYLKKTFS